MHCVITGEEQISVVSAWEWHRMHAGFEGVNTTDMFDTPHMEMNYSPLNLYQPDMYKFPRSRGLHPL
jgi:hypothetical protein